MKKPLKITLIVLGSIIGLLVLVTLLISPIATSYINKNGESLVGRKIAVDKLKVNVWGGHVAIHNLKLYEEDGEKTFVAFDTLDVKAKLLKLLSHEVYLKHITLAGLDVNVWQKGTEFNFTSLIDHFASNDTIEEEKDTTASDWKMSFYNIRLSHGKVYYADLERNCDWNLKDLNIKVPGFCIGGDSPTDAGLSIELADGGILTTDAHYDINTNDFDVALKLDKFALENIRAYVTDFMKIGKIDGNLNADIKAVGNVSQIMDMVIKGNVNVNDVDIKGYDKSPVLAVNQLAVDVNTIKLSNNLYDIKSVLVDGLVARFDMFENTNNFSKLMVESAASTDTIGAKETQVDSTSAESAPMNLVIGSFDFTNGRFTYADHTLPDEFEFPVSNISMHAQNVSLSGRNAATIKASLPHGGNAMIKWEGTLDEIKEYQNLMLNIRNLQLADLSPYTVAYLGQPFTEGVFSFISNNTIKNSQLEGQNHLDIYKPTVGKKRKDVDAEINIPLKAALYILKDKNDKVQIDLPISGDLDNPEFKYMKVVWKTLGNLLVKVATEPFRMAGNALGIGGNDEQFIAFDAMQQDITSEQYYNLEKYASAALQNNNLYLKMQQKVDEAADSTMMQLAQQRNQLVLEYLTKEMNVPQSQITMEIVKEANLKKTGYLIIGELKDTEE